MQNVAVFKSVSVGKSTGVSNVIASVPSCDMQCPFATVSCATVADSPYRFTERLMAVWNELDDHQLLGNGTLVTNAKRLPLSRSQMCDRGGGR